MLRAKLIGWAMKVLTEMLDRADVRADSGLGVVTPPQLLKHDLA
jgi:hypothetical protein